MDNLQTLAHCNNLSVFSRLSKPTLSVPGQNSEVAMELNQLLVRQASSTQLLRINGHQWADQGILDGDVAVIDRAMQAGTSDLIVAWQGSKVRLVRQHQLSPEDTPWGVVTAVIHQYR